MIRSDRAHRPPAEPIDIPDIGPGRGLAPGEIVISGHPELYVRRDGSVVDRAARPSGVPDALAAGGAVPMFRSRRGAAAKGFARPVAFVAAPEPVSSPFWQGFRWGLIGTVAVVIATLAVILTVNLAQIVFGGGG